MIGPLSDTLNNKPDHTAWDRRKETAFNKLKAMLSSKPVVRATDNRKRLSSSAMPVTTASV